MNEAFVYKWTDVRNSKFYIGYHAGTFDDGYVCSSKTMLKEYKERTSDFSREILKEGSIDDCRAYEIKLLKSIDAASSPLYYNLNNGGYHIVFTDEVRKKMSDASKGKPKTNVQWLTGKKMSDEMKAKISASNMGKVRSSETRKKMSIAQSKIPRVGGWKQSDHQKKIVTEIFNSTAECPHCGKVARKSAISRYHGENCKQLQPEYHI